MSYPRSTHLEYSAGMTSDPSCSSRGWPLRLIRRSTGAALGAMCLFTGLAGCATHRAEPPRCKGPFTPINQSPVMSHEP
jgi:hypothetical protein